MMLFTLQLLDPVIHAVEKLLMTADCLCAPSTPSSRVPLRGGCRDQDRSATKRQSDVLFLCCLCHLSNIALASWRLPGHPASSGALCFRPAICWPDDKTRRTKYGHDRTFVR